jgi:hydroxymethylpyrimidine/phosphomethylpyrimidine kinase
MKALPKVLTIAGSDSGGGAGIQADLKTFTVLQTYGMSVITALTAQNTRGVRGIFEVDPAFVRSQIEAVLDDIGADAVKTGMLASAPIVHVVADALERYVVPNLVVDPVMISKSGHALLLPDAVQAVKERLIPLAAVITPNTEEAAVLTGMERVSSPEECRRAAEKLYALGPKAVLLKGGHATGANSDDIWFDGSEWATLSSPRLSATHTHGTGCTLSAALAAYLAKGYPPPDAARRAKEFITGAIRAAWPLGGGIGPVNHLWEWEQR